MNKGQLVKRIAEKHGVSEAEAGRIIDTIFSEIKESVKADKSVAIFQFGTFKLQKRAARDGINPKTKEKIKIPASKSMAFKASKSIKEEFTKN